MRDSHTGKTHSEETRAQMSYAKSGALNPMSPRGGMVKFLLMQ
jgi:NUMOD3 motif